MEPSTTIKKMLAGNKIFVPNYQRAYSWETENEQSKPQKQTNVFLSDLEDYNRSLAKTPYYFGHFLFEEKANSVYGVIDGQQRLTTIVIFLSALFSRLKDIRKLTEPEIEYFEDIIKRNSTYRFSTVDYDNQFFKDYVIDKIKKDKNNIETESAKRIVKAYDFYSKYLSDKDESYLSKMIETIGDASCTTHPVTDESEAIQMFIFQNNRGKKPSSLEIIKAQFMFNVHLYGGDEKDALIEEIKNRFEKIYKSISSVEYLIDEDDVLVYTLRVHFNSLWESNAIDKINKILSETDSISFIKLFTQALAQSFEHLTTFFGNDERENIEIHSLVTLGGIGIAIPFIIKAYKFGLKTDEICKLSSSLETLVLRHRLIGTRADLTSRINGVFQSFTDDNPIIQPILDKVHSIKNSNDWWWAYWNNSELEKSIQGDISHSTAKFLLWKYENYLESQGKNGYAVTRFDKIENPELEHIAPVTKPSQKAHGYNRYDEGFINEYINCLGNFLLVSKSHNCAVGNNTFEDKLNTYNHLAQQREIRNFVSETGLWDRKAIQNRKDKIVKFILENY